MSTYRRLLMTALLSGHLLAQGVPASPNLERYYEAIRQVESIRTAAGKENPQQFVREYSYQAGDDDSKNTARTKCLDYVRKELMDEVGVYLQSDFLRKVTATKTETSSSYQEIVRQEIKELSAGITEMKIQEESWDGKIYHVKAIITMDPDSVREGIMLALKGKITDAEVLRLNSMLGEQSQRLQETNTKYRDAQNRLVTQELYQTGVERRIQEVELKLADLKEKERIYDEKERAAQSEVEKILAKMDDLTNRALTRIKLGMTTEEVRQLVGPSRASRESHNYSAVGVAHNYGHVWIIFYNGLATEFYTDTKSWPIQKLPSH